MDFPIDGFPDIPFLADQIYVFGIAEILGISEIDLILIIGQSRDIDVEMPSFGGFGMIRSQFPQGVKQRGIFKDFGVKIQTIQLLGVLDGEGEIVPIGNPDSVGDDLCLWHIGFLALWDLSPCRTCLGGDHFDLAIDPLPITLFKDLSELRDSQDVHILLYICIYSFL